MLHTDRRLTCIQALRKAGLADSNLQVCLDAGDANSYPGGQTWFDTSGKGHDFWLGDSAAVEAFEPSRFVGTVGDRNDAAFVISAGGCNFKLKQAVPAWVTALHSTTGQGTVISISNGGQPNVVGYLYRTDAMTGVGTNGSAAFRNAGTGEVCGWGIVNGGGSTFGNFLGQQLPKPRKEILSVSWQITGAGAGANVIRIMTQGCTRETNAPTVVANGNTAATFGIFDYDPGDLVYAFIMWNRQLTIPELQKAHRYLWPRFKAAKGNRASA
jgi:hypothetical protein